MERINFTGATVLYSPKVSSIEFSRKAFVPELADLMAYSDRTSTRLGTKLGPGPILKVYSHQASQMLHWRGNIGIQPILSVTVSVKKIQRCHLSMWRWRWRSCLVWTGLKPTYRYRYRLTWMSHRIHWMPLITSNVIHKNVLVISSTQCNRTF